MLYRNAVEVPSAIKVSMLGRPLEQPLPGPADVRAAQVNLEDGRQGEHAPARPGRMLESRNEHRAQPEQDQGDRDEQADDQSSPPGGDLSFRSLRICSTAVAPNDSVSRRAV